MTAMLFCSLLGMFSFASESSAEEPIVGQYVQKCAEIYDWAGETPVFNRLKFGFIVHHGWGHGWGGTRYSLTINSDLSIPKDINEVADKWDTKRFFKDLEGFNNEYLIFTVWNAEMNPLFPCKAMDKWRGPGHCPKRDVIGEIVAGAKKAKMPLYLYIHPSDGHDMQKADQDRLAWNESEGDNWAPGKFTKWNQFMNEVFEEMSQRYGSDVTGYWIDGGWGRVDPKQLVASIRKHNPKAEFVSGADDAYCGSFQKYGKYDFRDVNTWPVSDVHSGILLGGCWASTGGPAKHSPETMFKFTVLMAGTCKTGGGMMWAAGPYSDCTWEPNVKEYLTILGSLIRPIEESIKNTYASPAYPTEAGSRINSLLYGVVATRSVDGRYDYIHVLKAPLDNRLALPLPADKSTYTEARLLRDGRRVKIIQQDSINLAGFMNKGIVLEVPGDEIAGGHPLVAWDPLDTVIKLTR